jgi:hypothetical protein
VVNRLSHRGQEQRRAFDGRVGEYVLLAEYRFAAAGDADYQVDGVAEKPSVEDFVQA